MKLIMTIDRPPANESEPEKFRALARGVVEIGDRTEYLGNYARTEAEAARLVFERALRLWLQGSPA